MNVPPSSIEVGKCYLVCMERGLRVRRVLQLMPDGGVQFEERIDNLPQGRIWKSGVNSLRSFTFLVEHEVPCDWTSEEPVEIQLLGGPRPASLRARCTNPASGSCATSGSP